MKYLYTVISILLLSSCSATGPKFTNLELPPADKALIYILRPPAYTASLRRVNISINDKEIIKLKNKGYTKIELIPGTYEFKQSTNYIIGDPKILSEVRKFNLDVEASKRYFVAFHADSAVGSPWVSYVPNGTVMNIPLTFKYGFGVIEPESAEQQLAMCHYQNPEE